LYVKTEWSIFLRHSVYCIKFQNNLKTPEANKETKFLLFNADKEAEHYIANNNLNRK